MRRIFGFTAIVIAVQAMAALAPSTASAATTCRAYDGYGNPPQAGTFCVADADDYAWYNGWGYVKGICSSPWPADIDDPPLYQCMAYSAVPAWKWNGTSWTQISAGSGRAYLWKYAPGWRWAWREGQGWFAIQSSTTQITWFTPSAQAAPAAGRWG